MFAKLKLIVLYQVFILNTDYVYHFAAYAAEGLSPFIRKFNYTNNLLVTTNLVNMAIKHNVKDILEESLIHEQDAIDVYYDLLNEIKDKSVYLEEYCRSMIAQEEKDYNEMKKLIKDNS